MPRVNTLARTKPKTQKKPGEIFKRLMAYIFKNYKIHCIAVVVLILLSSLANIVGTMFMKKLIDDYVSIVEVKSSEDASKFIIEPSQKFC